MGEALLVEGGTLQCSHGGMLRLGSGNAAMKADGKAVITATMEVGKSFAGGKPGVTVPCPWPDPNTGAPSPCSATAPATSGSSQKTKIGGLPALLASASGPAINRTDPAATWSVAQAGQSKVTSA